MPVKKDFYKTIFLLPAVCLGAAAIVLRKTGTRMFYNVETGFYSAHYITGDTPFVFRLLWAMFKKLFLVYADDHLLPSFLLLLPAGLFMAVGISGLFPGRKFNGIKSLLKNVLARRIVLIVLFIAALAGTLTAHFVIMKDYPVITDEFSYVFQSELLADGKLYAQSPPMKDFFQTMNIINDGKWYSKYTVGWPLLLALGKLLGVRFAVGSVCVAISVVLLFLIGEKLVSPGVGMTASLFALFSPYVFLLGATFYPHAAAGLFALLTLYNLIKTFEDNSYLYPLATGLSFSFLMLIRPADSAIVFFSLVPFAVYSLYQSSDLKASLKKFLPAVIPIVLCLGILLTVNRVQTGNFFTFAFLKYNPTERWGFSARRHTPLKGLWNVLFSWMRMGFWTVPFIGFLSLVSFFSKKPRVYLLSIPYVGYSLFYLGWFGIGILEIGSRFYLPGFLISCISAAGGIYHLKNKWEKWKLPGGNLLAPIILLSVFIFMILGVYPVLIPSVKRQYSSAVSHARWMENPGPVEGKSLIFYLNDPGGQVSLYTRNYHYYKQQKNVHVLYLTPAENKNLITLFPGRNIYSIYFNPTIKKFLITSGVDVEETAQNYVFAAKNYQEGVIDPKKAEQSYKKALELDPQNGSIMLKLGNLYVKNKDYPSALKIFKKLSKMPGFADAQYLWGRTLGEMGRRREAVRVLEDFLKKTDNKFLAVKTRNWIDYYRQ